jgi:hypothetical protein
MSIKVMSWVWQHGPEAQGERFVLIALADFANDEGECWPSIDGIARKVCMTARGVQKVLRQLEADGWVSTLVGGGRNHCNSYRINLQNPEPRSSFEGVETPNHVHPEPRSPRTSTQERVNLEAERVNLDAGKGEPRSPEPSREPSRTVKGTVRERARDSKLPIPADWKPPPESLADAEERGFTRQDLENEAHQFCNHHRAHGSIRADWNAAWEKWLVDARKFQRSRGVAGSAQAGGGRRGASLAIIAARRRASGAV